MQDPEMHGNFQQEIEKEVQQNQEKLKEVWEEGTLDTFCEMTNDMLKKAGRHKLGLTGRAAKKPFLTANSLRLMDELQELNVQWEQTTAWNLTKQVRAMQTIIVEWLWASKSEKLM